MGHRIGTDATRETNGLLSMASAPVGFSHASPSRRRGLFGPAKKLKTTKIVIKKGAGHFVYEEKAAWKYWFGKY